MSYSPTDPTPVQVLVAPAAVDDIAAADAAQYLGEGVRTIIRDAKVTVAPIAAGGLGTSELFSGERITLPTTDASGELTEASYTLESTTGVTTAYIDAAAATGTTALSPGTSDSYGVGVLVADAATRGAERIVLALGDAVTDDGGAGLLVALGAHPLDQSGRTLPKGGAPLTALADFDTAKVNVPAGALDWLLLTDTDAAADTQAPGIAQLAEVTGVDPSTPGLGAGGAMGIGVSWLSALLHGDTSHVQLIPGSELIREGLDVAGLSEGADLILTAGASTPAFAGATAAGQALGAVLAPGAAAPETEAELLTAELAGEHATGSAADQLRDAGARLAADYLRISTVQG